MTNFSGHKIIVTGRVTLSEESLLEMSEEEKNDWRVWCAACEYAAAVINQCEEGEFSNNVLR